ncbi:MAG: energy-coupling factor transporter transmembrane protein EcfT [Atopobiaceae bacterium]|nr:energy-coupling factor transporter transmembrane protein EcfT [Atopobiaceae bacterium]
MVAPRARAFDAVHAAVPATLFAGVVALAMLAVQPALTAVLLAGALLFSLLARGAAATARGLAWQLPLLALVCLLNPLFSASGSTLLFKLGPRSVYLESLAYGATMGGLMVAVVLWLEGAAAVLTQDRLLALVPRRARALPLVAGMVAQLVPQLLRRSRGVRASLASCTAAGPRPGARDALTRTSSLLLSWSLEESLERADSMRARGWESGRPRTAYRPERLRPRDVAALAGIAALLIVTATCAWAVCAQWRFYPRMSGFGPWWACVPCALLALLPAAAELAARLRERGRR